MAAIMMQVQESRPISGSLATPFMQTMIQWATGFAPKPSGAIRVWQFYCSTWRDIVFPKIMHQGQGNAILLYYNFQHFHAASWGSTLLKAAMHCSCRALGNIALAVRLDWLCKNCKTMYGGVQQVSVLFRYVCPFLFFAQLTDLWAPSCAQPLLSAVPVDLPKFSLNVPHQKSIAQVEINTWVRLSADGKTAGELL